jgi:hypothetical protein
MSVVPNLVAYDRVTPIDNTGATPVTKGPTGWPNKYQFNNSLFRFLSASGDPEVPTYADSMLPTK